MSADIHQRLNDIRRVIDAFQKDQEKIIFNASDEYKYRANALASSSASNASAYRGGDYGSVSEVAAESSIGKILEQDAVLMPMGSDTVTSQKIWPLALVALFHQGIGKIGNIESHGSLWRLLPRKDSYVGQRVLLQASEIGEEPKYLTASLELSDLKADAAVWNLRVVDPPFEPTPVDFLDADAKGVTRGISLIFELVTAESLATLNSNSLSIVSAGLPSMGSKLLTCVHSPITGVSSLKIMNLYEAKQPDHSDPLLTRSFIWEACPEAWINDDMDFLEPFLH